MTTTLEATPQRRESTPTRLLRFLDESFTLRRPESARSARPRLLTHTVTFRCNARCEMCDSWKLPDQHELTLEEIERIYSELPPLDVVRLTGGEPFLRSDLGDIERIAATAFVLSENEYTSRGRYGANATRPYVDARSSSSHMSMPRSSAVHSPATMSTSSPTIVQAEKPPSPDASA